MNDQALLLFTEHVCDKLDDLPRSAPEVWHHAGRFFVLVDKTLLEVTIVQSEVEPEDVNIIS